jgi:TetR/AcrR family transcriptional repressor of nem operon
MKVSRKQVAENRGRIVDQAARLFREHGAAGVGVGEITAAAGLTHGGFYRQFESKEALFAEACTAALAEAEAELAGALRQPEGVKAFTRTYLRADHVSGPSPCPIVTLASDVAREPAPVQAAFAEGLRGFLAGGQGLEIGSPEWTKTTVALAATIGAMLMARAVVRADLELAEAIVGTVRP